MKLILVNQRYGHTRTIVIRGWMKGLLSLCLLGAPLALAYLGYELALADSSPNTVVSQNASVAEGDTQAWRDSTCADCMDYVLFDDAVEQAANHPCFNDNGPANLLVSQYELAESASTHVSLPSPIPLAVYPHGRPVDPARYAHVTLA